MKELKTEEFLDIIVTKIGELPEQVLQSNTNMIESNFPCRVVDTPLESVNKTENARPLLKTFQIAIEHWSDSQYNCMKMASKTDEKLRECNIIRTNTSPCIYKEVSQKYNLIVIYEVRWEALTNSFIYIK